MKDEPGSHCSPSGSVFVRPSGDSTFARLPLERERDGLLSALVPARDVRAGFDYYVVMDDGRGRTATLPEAGAEAPQHVWTLDDWSTVDVGAAQFGHSRAPSSVVRSFSWGRGDAALGLDSGREQSRIGPSAFDVAPDGSVVLLDQVNRRLVVLRHGARPVHVPIEFSGVRATSPWMATEPSTCSIRRPGPGSGLHGRVALDRRTRLAEPTADMIRVGPSGPLVHSYPSEMWLPNRAGTSAVRAREQLASAQPPEAP